MDTLDKKILECLQKNARQSASDIGKTIHLSVSTGDPEACLKNHSCSLHASLCAEFCPHSADAALIQTKSSTNCDVHLTESIFQTRSKENT